MTKSQRIVASWTETVLLCLETATQPTSLSLGPPPVARALAIIYTAAFEAWAAYTAGATPPVPGGPARRPAGEFTDVAKKAEAISYAIHAAAVNVFPDPALAALLDAKLTLLGYPLPPAPGDTAAATGLAAAQAIITARLTDNSNQAGGYEDTTGYASLNPAASVYERTPRSAIPFPSRWQPLTYFNPSSERVRTPGFITPQWKDVTPFALTSGSQFRPADPPASVYEERYLDQAKHVLDVQRKLTLQQKVIAEYWADGPKSWLPPGHWCSFGLHVSERGDASTHFKAYGIDQDVKMFFALSNAVFDASIATWDAKFRYDSVRPITAIRWLFAGHTVEAWLGAGGGIGPVAGECWRPFQKDTFPTPPFPEYTSGHSAFSMAAAVVLQKFTGSDTFGGAFTHTGPLAAEPENPKPAVTIEWLTFTEAALQAGESRIFGGIHFHEGNLVGLKVGREVGVQVWNKAVTLFNDPAYIPISPLTGFGI